MSLNIVAKPVNTNIIPMSPKSCGDKRRVRITGITRDTNCPPILVRPVHAIPVRILLSKSCTFSPKSALVSLKDVLCRSVVSRQPDSVIVIGKFLFDVLCHIRETSAP